MALNLTGKLSEVFERIGVDIADIFNKLNSNTDSINNIETRTTNTEITLSNLTRIPPMPPPRLNGAVLTTKLLNGRVIYSWESLSELPINAVPFETEKYPNLTLRDNFNLSYFKETGEVHYHGGILTVNTREEGTIKDIQGGWITLNLPTDTEEEFRILMRRPAGADGYPNQQYNMLVFLSDNPSAIDVYNNKNLQSIMLTLTAENAYRDIWQYRVKNDSYNEAEAIGTAKLIDTITIKNKQLTIIKDDGSRNVYETSNDIKYLHCVITNELGTFLTSDTANMKLLPYP